MLSHYLNTVNGGNLYSVSANGQRSRVGRNTQYGVGKDMMGQVYFHKNYAEDVVPSDLLAQARAIAEDRGFDYNTMMYDPKSGVVRLVAIRVIMKCSGNSSASSATL